MSRLWAGYVGQLGRRLKINSTHSTKASESSSQNKQTNNYYVTVHRCPCLTQKQNATVGVGRQCLTLGRAGLTVATDSDVCRPMWIILCGHFSQMSPLAKQSVRNQNWCLAHNLLPFTTSSSGDMGIFWYVVWIPRILVNPVELVNLWEIMKLLEKMNPVKLLSLLPTVTLLRDCCDIALFLLSKNRKG